MTETAAGGLGEDAIQRGYANPEWGGWGYLKARRELNAERRALADGIALHQANRRGWTEGRFFLWLDSVAGRHFAEFVDAGERYDVPGHPELRFHEDRSQFFTGDWAGDDGPVVHERETAPLTPEAWGLRAGPRRSPGDAPRGGPEGGLGLG